MCGIAGIVDFSGQPIDGRLLDRWLRLLRHRGPDDAGLWTGQCGPASVGLAHTRLAVLDPSPAGRQPFHDPDDVLHLVYNGEIYNYRQLREELARLHDFRSDCDTEVLLAAYRHWGIRCFNHLRGMWSAGFVDERGPQLLLARDRFGIKPLYWAAHGPRFIFASEMAALLAVPDWPTRIDRGGLAQYLRWGFIAHPRTILAGIHKLPPGAMLTLPLEAAQRPEPRIETYYRLPEHPPGEGTVEYGEACERVRALLADAVLARQIAHVPLGAFLSGGVDSSIVVGHLARASSRPVKTFCIGYADQPQYDETAYARQVAEHFATEHHEFKLTFAEVLGELPGLLDHLGEPFADASLLPTSVVSRQTRSVVTVALSGDGGDELFAGYWRYRGHAWMDRYQRIPRWLRRGVIGPLVSCLPAGKGSPWLNRARQARKLLRGDFDQPIARHLAWASILAPEAESILAKGDPDLLDEKWTRRAYEQAAATGEKQPWLSTLLRGDLGLLLPGDMLHKVDMASMKWSLEVRLPMLDPALVEYVSALPAEYKLHDAQAKRVLIDAHRDLLPPAVLTRPKMGFELPIGEFLRHQLRDFFLDTADRATLHATGCFDPDAVHRLYERHCKHRGEYADLLYAVLVFCHWWRQVFSPARGG